MQKLPGYRLWIGHVGNVRDPRELVEAGIVAVVDLALNESSVMLGRELVYCRFPLLDGAGNPRWLLRMAVDTVAGLLRSDTPALVYCSAGMSRSPAVVGRRSQRLADALWLTAWSSQRRIGHMTSPRAYGLTSRSRSPSLPHSTKHRNRQRR